VTSSRSKKEPDTAGKTSRKPPNAGKGRPPGATNHTTRVLKEAILTAAAHVGEDGKGKDGLTGYMVRLAKRQPRAFAGLLGRVLPTEIKADGAVALVPIQKVHLVPVVPVRVDELDTVHPRNSDAGATSGQKRRDH